MGSRKTYLFFSKLHVTKSWNHFLFSSHSTQNHDIQLSNLHFSNFITKPFLLANYQSSHFENRTFDGSVVGEGISDFQFMTARNTVLENLFNVTYCSFVDCFDQRDDKQFDKECFYNGGALYLNLAINTRVIFNRSNFTNCTAYFRGGAIFINAPTPRTVSISFNFCEFIQCNLIKKFETGGYGAAVVVNQANDVSFKYVAFINNSWYLGKDESSSYYNSLFIGDCTKVDLSDVTFQSHRDFFKNQDFTFTIYDLGLNNIYYELKLSRCCFASNGEDNISSIILYSIKEGWPERCSFQNCFFSSNSTNFGVSPNISGIYTYSIKVSDYDECGYWTMTPTKEFNVSEAFFQTNAFSLSYDFTESASLISEIETSDSNYSSDSAVETTTIDDGIVVANKTSVLSTGAIAGIVVGCAALLAIIIALLVLFCRSKPRAFKPPNADPTNIDGFDVPII